MVRGSEMFLSLHLSVVLNGTKLDIKLIGQSIGIGVFERNALRP